MDALARMAERIERAALEDLHSAATAEVREALGLRLETIGEVAVSVATRDPAILLNRAIGLGVESNASRETLDTIVSVYRQAGVGRFYLHVHPDARPEAIWDWLPHAGFERGRAWMKFRRVQVPAPRPRAGFEVRVIGEEESETFGRIVREGFGMREASVALLARLVHRPRWRLYLALDGSTPAGAAGLFLDGGAAWFDWAATRPEFRGRGVQNALLCRRIADAIDAGCRALFAETGEAVPGDPQHSYRNILRSGFEAMHLRENFVPRSGSPS